MEKKLENLEFLQSAQWRQFQASVGHKTFCLEREGFLALIIEHNLPIVGKYLYYPRGPVTSLEGEEFPISNFQFPSNEQIPKFKNNIKNGMHELVKLAEKEKAGWIRIEPENEDLLEYMKDVLEAIRPRRTEYRIIKAPHDMQPKEVFVLDITKSQEQLLAEMKSKTRYNIRLSQKHKVSVKAISNFPAYRTGRQFPYLPAYRTGRPDRQAISNEYVEAFLKLTKEMATRHGITAHPENYYRKMIEILPSEMLKIYVAEYDGPASTRGNDHSSTRGGKIIAANLVLFYGKTATYLHGASSNDHRNVMAPFLLQWQAILDAKKLGFEKYDFGGIKSTINNQKSKNNKNTWEGTTTFKLGFSPSTKPVEFPGSYDIIVNPRKYGVYKILQKLKKIFRG